MIDGPTSQGSSRIVKDPGNRPGEDSGATGGLKTSKKDVSPFSDLTDSDMVADTQRRTVPHRCSKRHERKRVKPLEAFTTTSAHVQDCGRGRHGTGGTRRGRSSRGSWQGETRHGASADEHRRDETVETELATTWEQAVVLYSTKPRRAPCTD